MEYIALGNILLIIIALEGALLCYRMALPSRPKGPPWREEGKNGELVPNLPHSHECKTIGEQLQFIGCAVRDLLDQELRAQEAKGGANTKGPWKTEK